MIVANISNFCLSSLNLSSSRYILFQYFLQKKKKKLIYHRKNVYIIFYIFITSHFHYFFQDCITI